MKSCNYGTRNWNVVPEEAIRILHYWNHKIFGVIRQAKNKTEGKQSIPDSSMLVIQERIIPKCDSSAIQKSMKLLQVVNIPRVHLSCIWKKLKHQMTAGICADLVRKLWPQLSLNKRETFIYKYRTKRNHARPSQKYFKCCQHPRIIQSPEKILLCFLFSLI